MPIQKINPDGTVRIYNTKTKEQKDVKPEDLAKYNPSLENDYQVLQSIKSGHSNLSGMGVDAQKQFTGALEGSGIVPPPASATERTQVNNYQSALDLTNDFDLGKRYDKADTGPLQAKWTETFENIAPGLVDKNLLELNSNIGPIREAVVNAISGAQVSAEEAKRVNGWIPSISKSKEKNKADLNSLKTWLSSKYRASANQDYAPRKSNNSTGKYTIEEIQ